MSCLAINWSWQVGYLYKLVLSGPSALHATLIVGYLTVISQVVYDDVVLVRWLWKNARKTAASFSKLLAERMPGSPQKMRRA